MFILKSTARPMPGVLSFFVLALVFSYAAVLFTWLVSVATAQHIAPGEMPQGRFYVVFVPGPEGAPFDSADIRNIGQHKGTFLLPKAGDRFSWPAPRAGYETYKVLEKSGAEQLIEVHHHNGDYDFWSRYKASPDKVVPVYSRMVSVAEGFYALPFAGVVAWLGWLLMRRGWSFLLMLTVTAVWCGVLPLVWACNTSASLSQMGYWEMLGQYVPELAVGAVFLVCLPIILFWPRLAVMGLLLAAVLAPVLQFTLGSPANGWVMSALLLSLLSWRLHVLIASPGAVPREEGSGDVPGAWPFK